MFEQVEVNSKRWLDLKNLKNEIWKNISEYENSYLISNYGRVKSLKRKVKNKTYEEKIMKLEKNKDGYLRVDLYRNNNKKHKKVHRLLAREFLEGYNNNLCINHKDENKQNNLITNLELCSYSYNINYGNRNKKVSDKLSKKVNQYDLNGNFIKTWNSIISIKRELNINPSYIYKCCNNKIKNVNGFIFKYNNFTNN